MTKAVIGSAHRTNKGTTVALLCFGLQLKIRFDPNERLSSTSPGTVSSSATRRRFQATSTSTTTWSPWLVSTSSSPTRRRKLRSSPARWPVSTTSPRSGSSDERHAIHGRGRSASTRVSYAIGFILNLWSVHGSKFHNVHPFPSPYI
jgi:hypothetical protein